MIKAIVKSGAIFPQSELPSDWKEGEPLIIEAARDWRVDPVDCCEPLEPIAEEDLQTMLVAINQHRQEQKLRMAEDLEQLNR